MHSQGDPLLKALDGVEQTVPIFIRDDDAGWADERLVALLRTVHAVDVPIDLAAIPCEVQPALVSELRARRADGQRLGIHQHGFAHTNHEITGRKSEFGASRRLDACVRDIAAGAEQLRGLLGDGVDAIFTPPWNRVAAELPSALQAMGFAALSRDVTAGRQHDIAEIAVHTDWSKQCWLAQEAGDDAARRVSADMARHVTSGCPLGLMLHHAVMPDAELELLQSLLRRWGGHPRLHWVLMGELLPVPLEAA